MYDPSDPRVKISTGSTITIEELTRDHAPVVTPDEVGYVFVRFLTRALPVNITMTLICTIGQRKDTLVITSANQKNVIWKIFSDKYADVTSFQYKVQMEVDGANFTDVPVTYGTAQPVTVPLPTGRIKYISGLPVPFPIATPAQHAIINQYIKAVQQQQ